ncbi:DUF4405 domain-containing protein [Pyrococcus yayanosii]|uniref:Flavinylation-associated cytochrome domain-containing protein n=1 Tax=Pyrococcus yayanosii (strain CH1 / JCM 16557) TaxID=529709 RepID=F8AJD1_PYRYC|nr:DUF4405 domain-containing protein [Pyrococcus yayanosii]AEH24871.1 hypothetical protein PYCH_11930 [Pyrococcus yayanosii CH1]
MGIRLRMWVSIVLFFLWLITGISGTVLLLGPLFPSLPVSLMDTIHMYAGFAFFGLSVVHIALNWGALKSYFRKVF